METHAVPSAAAPSALEAAREQVHSGLARGEPGRTLVRAFSDAADAMVSEALQDGFSAAPTSWGPLCLAALGGLGRRELGPWADLDLVLLLGDDVATGGPEFDEFVRGLVHPLWDAGWRANVMVDAIPTWLEGAGADLTLCTGLCDVRPLLGDPSITDRLRTRAAKAFFGSARGSFLDRLADEAEVRHAKYGGTVFLVEPDLKYGPGGLRDLAAMGWALRATYGSRELEALAEGGAVPPRMAASLQDAADVLLRLRSALHLAAKRPQERLVFQYQEALPSLLGMGATGSDEALVASIEEMMQDYYQAARAVLRYGTRLRTRVRPVAAGPPPTPKPVDERFAIESGRLVLQRGVSIAQSPVLALDALALTRERQVRLAGGTFDAISEVGADPLAAGIEHEPQAQLRLLDLLTHPDDVGAPSALELAAELGLVEAVVPEFGPIRGRMQHDSYHVYTVDQHTLAAIGMLKRIARGEHNKDYPLATALHLEVDDPRVLYLATLLHDAGKATTGDQCETGAVIARVAATRAGLGARDVERCALLVAEHLSMPLLSQKRDLSDPLLIAEFADRIASVQTLRELYLLSLVDTASVRPGNLTAWKLTLLDELYLQTRAHLRRGTIVVPVQAAGDEDPPGMPARYFSLFHLDMRRQHGEMVTQLAAEERNVLVDLDHGSGALRLTLVARDRPGLLAQTTSILEQEGIEVLAGDVFSTSTDPSYAVDIFRVAAKGGHDHGISVETVSAIESALHVGLSPAELAEPPPPRRMSRWSRNARVATSISFDEDPSRERTIVEVETAFDHEVLWRVTLAFAAVGLEILLARSNVEAERASHVYYVAAIDEAVQARLSERIVAYLGTDA